MVKFLPGQQGAIETRWKEIAGKEVRLCLQHLSRLHETERIAREAVSVGTSRNEHGNGQGKLEEGFGCAGLSLVRALHGRQLKMHKGKVSCAWNSLRAVLERALLCVEEAPGRANRTVVGALRRSHGFVLKHDSSDGKRRRGLFAARAASGNSFP